MSDLRYARDFSTAETHFSRHVFADQSAYMRAAGSLLARKPWSRGGRSNALMSTCTSSSSCFAMELANTTLHELDSAMCACSVLRNEFSSACKKVDSQSIGVGERNDPVSQRCQNFLLHGDDDLDDMFQFSLI